MNSNVQKYTSTHRAFPTVFITTANSFGKLENFHRRNNDRNTSAYTKRVAMENACKVNGFGSAKINK